MPCGGRGRAAEGDEGKEGREGRLTRDEISEELRRLALAEKTVAGAPEWTGDDLGASPLLRLTTPLCIGGAIVSGLSLRMVGPRACPPQRPFFDLRAMLTATVGGQLYHLGRIEFDPQGADQHHKNPFGARRFAPPDVTGPHHHSFAENAQLGLSSFEPASNLPVALAEERVFQRFDDVLEVVRSRFVIPGFWTEDPEWLRLLA